MSYYFISDSEREPWMPTKEDYDRDGVDHWADCDDPFNCNCANEVTTPHDYPSHQTKNCPRLPCRVSFPGLADFDGDNVGDMSDFNEPTNLDWNLPGPTPWNERKNARNMAAWKASRYPASTHKRLKREPIKPFVPIKLPGFAALVDWFNSDPK